MKDSEVVLKLAELASKVRIEVTPENINSLASTTNALFEAAANLINRLEAEESEDGNDN